MLAKYFWRIASGQIATLEIATEENLKKMAGAVGWGFLGGLALGPIGALAGVLAGGRKTELTFICQFKDGRKFLGQCDPKTYTAIQAAQFVVQPKRKISPPPPAFPVILMTLVIFVGLFWLIRGTATPDKSHTNTLNPSALKLVTYLVADDMNGMLARDQNSPVWPKVEGLAYVVAPCLEPRGSKYEARYDANEIVADDDFKGKRILVTGAVSSVSKDFTDESYVVLRGSGLMGVRAQLSETGAQSMLDSFVVCRWDILPVPA